MTDFGCSVTDYVNLVGLDVRKVDVHIRGGTALPFMDTVSRLGLVTEGVRCTVAVER